MNARPPVFADVRLDDKYRRAAGRIFASGNQVLVRLAIQQRLRDEAAGLNTAGYVSGYRGSPLGRFDMEMWAAGDVLAEHRITFRAAVNEDLAATALWGSQYVGSFPGAKYDGVFGIFYGKGPGIDRSGDVFRHANSAGTSRFGGVLALAGDDHGAKSSTITNFSDQIFTAVGMPLLYPSNAQELLDFGLHGIALSRYCGCWVGMKVVTDIVEGGGTVEVGLARPAITLPELRPAPELGAEGWNIRKRDTPQAQEERLYHHKLAAAMAYIRANALNRVMHDAPEARVGVIAAGKSYQDVLQAMAEMGLTGARCRDLGLRIAKVGAIWPLDPAFVRAFAAGLDEILVVEEKRPLLENQVKAALYDTPARPRIAGKFIGATEWDDDRGAGVLARAGELAPPQVATAIAQSIARVVPDCGLAPTTSAATSAAGAVPLRAPAFCSGCPHNRSTRVPEGSRALAGIGCHTIAMYQDPEVTTTVSHMGGEGAMWLGQQPFTEEKHVFANMGDGTYFHSGFLALRQAVAANVPMTYKILVNGFVSMTGGQKIDGDLTLPRMVAEVAAEGVREIAVVTDDPERMRALGLPPGTPVHHRRELAEVQRRLREYPGVSVIFYDQPCATERRRLRKRGEWDDPPRRVFINAAVCEGCGDCSRASNCLSIEPLETPFGRKRRINQASCNKDYSCLEGFCPSFVTVHGGKLRGARDAGARDAGARDEALPPLPEPELAPVEDVTSVLVTGIGGTGVVTIGQVLGMAAHLDGLAVSILDLTGLAQKYGAVMSHVRFARGADALHATRIAAGEADAVIGCDLIVTAGDEALAKMRAGRTRVVLGTDLVPTAQFARDPEWRVDVAALAARVAQRCAKGDVATIDALRIAGSLLGDPIAANMFMLGFAWQRGLLPVSCASIDRAIELNGVAVEFNRRSFEWGRRAAHDPAAVERRAAPAANVVSFTPRASLAALVDERAAFLTAYQDAAYAGRYRALVERVMAAERAAGLPERLSRAVALYYFKLLAIKDEWEVARLFAAPEFRDELKATFDGDYRLTFHLGAWPFAGVDRSSGLPTKGEVGPWVLKAFRVMARLRRLRGTWLDPFRGSSERALDRRLLAEYEADVEALIATLDAAGYDRAVALASLPEKVRGYGHVRAASAAEAAKERGRLLNEAPAAARVA